MSIVSFKSDKPCDLCIVEAHDICKGIFHWQPLLIGLIGIFFGLVSSQARPM